MFQLDEFDENGCRHAFFGRGGGVSTGLYNSLNCGLGSGDSRDAVRKNRARAMAALDLSASTLVVCHQRHSADVAVIDGHALPPQPLRADGLVTRSNRLALGILTADCAPVLLADRQAGVVGAAHAGWRGALGGILEATVQAMVAQGAAIGTIVAAIGPCIGPDSYEVGPEFPGPFLEQDRSNAACFLAGRRDGHFMFDLPGYIGTRLVRLGLGDVLCLKGDTCADEVNFFSYRRSRLQEQEGFGRMLSIISLEP